PLTRRTCSWRATPGSPVERPSHAVREGGARGPAEQHFRLAHIADPPAACGPVRGAVDLRERPARGGHEGVGQFVHAGGPSRADIDDLAADRDLERGDGRLDGIVDVDVVERLRSVAEHDRRLAGEQALTPRHDHRLVSGSYELPRTVDE